MRFPVFTIFGSSVGEYPHQLQVMLFKERNDPVIEHVRRNKSVLPAVELGEADFGIGVDDRLLVDMPYAFYIPYMISVLRHKEAWIISLYFTMRLFLRFGFLQRNHLVLVKDYTFLFHFCG